MNDIQVGDLVQVIYPLPCCKANGSFGLIFIVKHIERSTRCPLCKMDTSHEFRAGNAEVGIGNGFVLSRLKKIPPLSELEDTNIKETVEA